MDRLFFLDLGMQIKARENPLHKIAIIDENGTPLMGVVPDENNGVSLVFVGDTDEQMDAKRLKRHEEEQIALNNSLPLWIKDIQERHVRTSRENLIKENNYGSRRMDIY